MARISSCRTRVVTRKMANAPWNPRTRWTEKNVVLVFLETDGGELGVGEAFCDGGATDSVVVILERDFGPLVVGSDTGSLAATWQRMFDTTHVSNKGGAAYAALSAIDIALWDLAGKVARLPTWNLLGGCRDRVPAYASAGLYGEEKAPSDLGREMAGYVERGFRAVKMKVAGAPLAEDVARVAAAREAIGPGVRLMVDALYALSPTEAVRMARALEKFEIHFLEAPVARDDVAGLARVARDSPIPVAGNEFASGLNEFRRLLEHQAVDVVHLDAILCGGISEAMRIAALAGAFHKPVSFHAASSVVCFAANLQVAAAVANAESIEWHMLHDLLFDRIGESVFRLEDGCVVMPQAAGLGFDARSLLDA